VWFIAILGERERELGLELAAGTLDEGFGARGDVGGRCGVGGLYYSGMVFGGQTG
jgi:hypothetical protein